MPEEGVSLNKTERDRKQNLILCNITKEQCGDNRNTGKFLDKKIYVTSPLVVMLLVN